MLEQLPLVEQAGQLGRVERSTEAGPQHEVLGPRDGRRRVDLQEAEVADDLEDVRGPVGVEALGHHGDLAGSVERQRIVRR